jgi:HK97 family phage prohead protease
MKTRSAAERPKQSRHFDNVQIRVVEDDLPAGIVGRISAVALPFNQEDSYGTSFAQGCAARSIGQKVKARKVPFLLDHDRRTGSHAGTIMSVEDAGTGYLMGADVLDTRLGRETMEYVKALIASGGTTGVSIGFIPRKSEFKKSAQGRTIEVFTEIELSEISLTPMPAVPGAEVIGARKEEEGAADPTTSGSQRDDITLMTLAARAALDALPDEARAEVLKQYGTASPKPSEGAAPAEGEQGSRTTTATESRDEGNVSMDERIAAVRKTFVHTP